MLFLLGAYKGVADGSLDYIRESQADLWVLHKNTNNILRGQSILPTRYRDSISTVPGVTSVSPILLLLSKIEARDGWSSVYLVGYDPYAGTGGPPAIVSGHGVESDDQIVLDRAFAAKWKYDVGDTVTIQDSSLRIVGISDGTNAFVIQYAFVSLTQSRRLLGLIPVVSCFLVHTDGNSDLFEVSTNIRACVPDAAVYTHDEFLANNAREMQVGFLPFIITIATIGSVVLTTLLSLLLSISILEARPDFATIKIVGAPRGFLPRLIVCHALLVAIVGMVLGILLIFPLIACVKLHAPEVAFEPSIVQELLVSVGVGLVSVVSALAAMQRLRRIYPLEAFQ
jgi:putative ABC transport system permease protein